jgi:hypothetical protein
MFTKVGQREKIIFRYNLYLLSLSKRQISEGQPSQTLHRRMPAYMTRCLILIILYLTFANSVCSGITKRSDPGVKKETVSFDSLSRKHLLPLQPVYDSLHKIHGDSLAYVTDIFVGRKNDSTFNLDNADSALRK